MSSPTVAQDHKLRVNIRNRDLLCVNGCGFYGTPQWENRCSKCWRLHQLEQKKSDDYMKNRLAFSKFEERRKLSTESRSLTIKNILKKSPSLLLSPAESQGSPVQHVERRNRNRSPESQEARYDFSEFLSHSLPSNIAMTISKSLHELTSTLYDQMCTPEDMGANVQSYYQHLESFLSTQPQFLQNKLTIRVQDVLEAVERYICAACYERLFWGDSAEEVQDLSLQDRIKKLQWVTFGFLETKLDLTSEATRLRLDEAITEMIDINSHRKVDEKLACLLRCSHKIFDALRESGAPTSADEFLPALIYVILKGNPPLIQGNVRFISRFALPMRVMSGESAYFFTNVSGALQFVQDINHEWLKMSREEFEAYTSGELIPPLHKMACGCIQAVSLMESSLSRLERINEDANMLIKRIEEFKGDTSLEETLCEEIQELSTTFPSPKWLELREGIAAAEAETLKKE